MRRKIDASLIPPAPNLEFEALLWKQGVKYVAGIDEAGRGSIAGPVYAAAVILPNNAKIAKQLAGVRDSKELAALRRKKLAKQIRKLALAWYVEKTSPAFIDSLGIVTATRLACMRALNGLEQSADHILLDYLLLPEYGVPQTTLIKGDMRSLSIASASILAKVARDAEMVALDSELPLYGFAKHKGYGTKAHREALEKHGASPQHRLSFAPLRNL